MASIDRLLQIMIEKGASDFHICSEMKPILRLHGRMTEIEGGKPLSSEVIEKLFVEIAPESNKLEFIETHDTDFAYEVKDLARFRVNTFRDHKGVGMVIRQIPSKVLTADDLGLPKQILQFCNLSKGLVLVTGPTGSGKSTTLAAMIDYINKNKYEHIITIEDPIEFVHQNQSCLVNQRQIGRHTKSFKAALRAALREDPDIVLVGEMRDLETTEIALETAETGHLVFGTLHTNTAIGTVDRIINQFPADRQQQIRIMLSEALKGVVSQVLCRTADGKGRKAALEILYTTPAISNNIREGKIHQIASAMQSGKRYGMQTLNDDLLRLVREKHISPMEAYTKAVDKETIATQLKTAGFDLVAAKKSEAPAA